MGVTKRVGHQKKVILSDSLGWGKLTKSDKETRATKKVIPEGAGGGGVGVDAGMGVEQFDPGISLKKTITQTNKPEGILVWTSPCKS